MLVGIPPIISVDDHIVEFSPSERLPTVDAR
jgi:hypothetical protein